MHFGLTYGLENTSHFKSFQPSDLGNLSLHFDLSDIATHWIEDEFQYIKVRALTGSFDVSSDTVTLLCTAGQLFGTDGTSANFDNIKSVPGVFKIQNEYITYDSIDLISSTAITITGMSRGAFGSTEAAHADDVVANFLVTGAKVDPRCFDKVGRSIFLDIESNPASNKQTTPTKAGGYYTAANTNTTNHLGINNANSALFFNGADDTLVLSSDYVLQQSRHTHVFVVRNPINGNSASARNLDILYGGDNSGRTLLRLSQNNLRVRFNDDGSSDNSEDVITTNNTNNSTTSAQFLGDELNVITLTKNASEFMSLYYNGVLVGTETFATATDSITGILMSHIGRRIDAGGQADLFMELGEILIYDTELTAAQVTELTSHLTTKWTGGL